ncbi:MAG: hypothetical protein RL728_845 [Bacteroidota bacterium]
MGVDPIAILTILLPVISFLMGSNCFITADDSLNWKEPIILFSLLVGRKGTRKSPILKTIYEPLRQMLRCHQTDNVDYIFLDGTLEGMTTQLMINDGEMLQITNEAEHYLNKLYSLKGYYHNY